MTIPTLHGPGELLATLPHVLGFTPTESVVIVGIRTGGEVGGIMRVDREDCLLKEISEPMSRAVAAQLSRERCDSVILVSYTEHPVRMSCQALDNLRESLAGVVSRIDTWAVMRGRYFAPGCADEWCCPIEGLAVPAHAPFFIPDEPDHVMKTAATHSAARHPWGTAAAPERRRCSRAADRWALKKDADIDAWRSESLGLWRRTAALSKSTAYECRESDLGKLVASLSDVRVRDAVIVWLVAGPEQAIDDVLSGRPSDVVTRTLDAILERNTDVTLDEEQLNAMRHLLMRGIAHCRRKEAAPLLAVLALIEWWAGDSCMALSICDCATSSNPRYRLAELIRATILARLEPEWLE